MPTLTANTVNQRGTILRKNVTVTTTVYNILAAQAPEMTWLTLFVQTSSPALLPHIVLHLCESPAYKTWRTSLSFLFFFFLRRALSRRSAPVKLLEATPWRCLSSLTSHLIPSRPISSLLICSSNHSHHTHTDTHTHTHAHLQSDHIPAKLRPLVCLKNGALMILLLFTACVKPKVRLYEGFGTSACVRTHERVPLVAVSGMSLWFR